MYASRVRPQIRATSAGLGSETRPRQNDVSVPRGRGLRIVMPVGYYDQPHCRGDVNTEAFEVL